MSDIRIIVSTPHSGNIEFEKDIDQEVFYQDGQIKRIVPQTKDCILELLSEGVVALLGGYGISMTEFKEAMQFENAKALKQGNLLSGDEPWRDA